MNAEQVKAIRFIPLDSCSESPDDYCEECHDTGWIGDYGPGRYGNSEIARCECNIQFRCRRILARKNTKGGGRSSNPDHVGSEHASRQAKHFVSGNRKVRGGTAHG